MENKITKAIEELQNRIEGMSSIDEITECIADYKAEVSGERKNLNDLDWDEIADLMANPNKKKLFKIGSYKEEKLYTGEKVKMQLISLDPHDPLSDYDKKASAAFMFFIDGEYEMNETSTNAGGWADCKMRNTYMQRFFKLLPEELRRVIKSVEKTTNGKITSDKLFLLSEAELTGKNNYSYDGEGKQYEYFKKNKLAVKWRWLRSPCPSGGYCFACAASGGDTDCGNAGCANRVALCFCI